MLHRKAAVLMSVCMRLFAGPGSFDVSVDSCFLVTLAPMLTEIYLLPGIRLERQRQQRQSRQKTPRR